LNHEDAVRRETMLDSDVCFLSKEDVIWSSCRKYAIGLNSCKSTKWYCNEMPQGTLNCEKCVDSFL